jgi:hypothetical protein
MSIESSKNSALLYLFSKELGLTLIGEKPMSFEECDCYEDHPIPQREREELISWMEGCFNKSSKYIFRTYSFAPGRVDIVLIHKPSFQIVATRDEYLSCFIKTHYGTVQDFFDYYRKSDGDIINCFKDDEIALGIALGYGHVNSEFLTRVNELSSCVYKSYGLGPGQRRLIPSPFLATHLTKNAIMMFSPPPVPQPSPGWASIEDELNWLYSIEQKIPQNSVPYLFSIPFFLARQGEETQILIRRYEKGVDRLSRIFQREDPSQVIKKIVEKSASSVSSS